MNTQKVRIHSHGQGVQIRNLQEITVFNTWMHQRIQYGLMTLEITILGESTLQTVGNSFSH